MAASLKSSSIVYVEYTSNVSRERETTFVQLERLHILQVLPGKPKHYSLTQDFAKSLRLALTGGGNHKSFGVPCVDPDLDNRPYVEDLDEYARNQWESVLGLMVGNPGKSNRDKEHEPNSIVMTLLDGGGLVKLHGRKIQITQEGFAFLLQDVNAQVWQILMLYLESAEAVSLILGNIS